MDAKLRKKAEDIGITVDPRWSDTTLQTKIDEKEADIKAVGPGGFIPNPNYPVKASKEALMGAAVDDTGKVLPTEATPKAIRGGGPATTEKGRLQQKAISLNIFVDDKWDEQRLRGEIQMARMGRADLQVKGAVPPAEWGNVDFDPATREDKEGKLAPGTIQPEPTKLPGVTIAGEPAVVTVTTLSGAVPTSRVVTEGPTK